MVKFDTISEESKRIIKSLINKMWNAGITNELDIYKHLIKMLYDLQKGSDNIVAESAPAEYRNNLGEDLTISEIDILTKESASAVYWCYKKVKEHKSRVEAFVPQSFISLCDTLSNREEKASVYLPFGDIDFAFSSGCGNFYFSEKNEDIRALDEIVLSACGINYSFVDSNTSCKKQFDYIYAIPPMGIRNKENISETLINIIEHSLSANGEMYCLFPMSFCFDKSVKGYYQLRKYICEQGYDITVISLPHVLMPISGVSTCCLRVIKKKGDITLVDASETPFKIIADRRNEHINVSAVVAALSEPDNKSVWHGTVIDLKNRLSLSPSVYTYEQNKPEFGKDEQLITLDKLVEIHKPCVHHTHGEEIKYITYSDLSSNHLSCNIDIQNIQKRSSCSPIKYDKCLLVSYFNNTCKVGKLVNTSNTPICVTRSIFCLQLRSNLVTEEYLLHALVSEKTLRQVRMLSKGVLLPHISISDFKKISIVVPPLETQNRIQLEDMEAQMSESEKELKKSYQRYQQEIHSRKHAMGQNLSALAATWDKLNNFRKKHDGILHDNDIVSQTYHCTIADLFDMISQKLNEICKQTESLADINYNFGASEDINPEEFINQYIASHKDVRCELIAASRPTDEDGNITIKIPHDALTMIFNNIVANAISHGFTDEERHDYKILFTCGFSQSGDTYEIRIANNGNPLPPKVKSEDIFLYGFSTSLSNGNHQGLGAYEIRNILEQYDAAVELESVQDEDTEFRVTYILKFSKTNIQ